MSKPQIHHPIRIATRASELALRQARELQALLRERGLESELATYRTVGDKKLDTPLSAIGAKGLFTEELERDLLKGKVDCCVHSLKDLPTAMPDGLVIGAVLEREDPRDVLVVSRVADARTLAELPRGSRVGTSSLRRRAQLHASHPDLEGVELRGNVPTRLRKVDEGHVHAAILAAAGLHRLDAHQHVTAYLDAPGWLPAAGQGAIAVQIRDESSELRPIVESLNHAPTWIAVRAERAFLGALEGGCQVPIGALAMEGAGAGRQVIHGFIASVNGRRVVRGSHELDPADPELSGIRLANDLRGRGASEILGELRAGTHFPHPQPE